MKRQVPSLIVAALLGGCAAKPNKIAVSPPPSPEVLDQIRSSYKAVFPNASVGVVTAVLDSDPYALVGHIDTASTRPGVIFTFLSGDQTVVANGQVVKVDPDGLTVRFDAGQRKPMVGDAAIKF